MKARTEATQHWGEKFDNLFLKDQVWAAREIWSTRVRAIKMTPFQEALLSRGLAEYTIPGDLDARHGVGSHSLCCHDQRGMLGGDSEFGQQGHPPRFDGGKPPRSSLTGSDGFLNSIVKLLLTRQRSTTFTRPSWMSPMPRSDGWRQRGPLTSGGWCQGSLQ